MHCRRSTAHCPQAVRTCIAGVPLPTAPCPQQQCSKAHTVQCGAEHQAVRHHTEGTGGAARHAGCSGPTRPCVTARRRRQGSVRQVRECTGPAMPQHTYTQRAHNTHSPARLPVPVGRHPGLCLLVTAPSAHHTTPHHTTPHQLVTWLPSSTHGVGAGCEAPDDRARAPPIGGVLTVSGARTSQCQAPSPGTPRPLVPAASALGTVSDPQ